jgi:predicted nucleic acid-binding protein
MSGVISQVSDVSALHAFNKHRVFQSVLSKWASLAQTGKRLNRVVRRAVGCRPKNLVALFLCYNLNMSTVLRVVVDTNVVFEGLTKQGGACGLVIDAWKTGYLYVHLSNALAYEYADVLSRKLSAARWQHIKPVLGALLKQGEFVPVHYSWRPSSPDPGDEHVIDCAMNAGAMIITSNVRDYEAARQSLGVRVVTPVELIMRLASH